MLHRNTDSSRTFCSIASSSIAYSVVGQWSSSAASMICISCLRIVLEIIAATLQPAAVSYQPLGQILCCGQTWVEALRYQNVNGFARLAGHEISDANNASNGALCDLGSSTNQVSTICTMSSCITSTPAVPLRHASLRHHDNEPVIWTRRLVPAELRLILYK